MQSQLKQPAAEILVKLREEYSCAGQSRINCKHLHGSRLIVCHLKIENKSLSKLIDSVLSGFQQDPYWTSGITLNHASKRLMSCTRLQYRYIRFRLDYYYHLEITGIEQHMIIIFSACCNNVNKAFDFVSRYF